jgi:hypothetical protein
MAKRRGALFGPARIVFEFPGVIPFIPKSALELSEIIMEINDLGLGCAR